MNKTYKIVLHIFRRDLRLEDNTALLHALAQAEVVIPCFILTPEQTSISNAYKSNTSLQFMLQSLHELHVELKGFKSELYLFYGSPAEVVSTIQKHVTLDAIFFNEDYTPYSKLRDAAIQGICAHNKITLNRFHDALLNPPQTVLKKDGNPYTIFTPFFNKALKNGLQEPTTRNLHNFYTHKIPEQKSITFLKQVAPQNNSDICFIGGRNEALNILKNIHIYENYKEERNVPALAKTTHLSAHLKFGTCSVREVAQGIKNNLGAGHPLLRQLYWRDFFTHIIYFFPHILGHAFHKKYDVLAWKNDTKEFKAWCEGKTGFPLVDAGMRQLNQTGFMHNRARMVVASFLTKDLHIDWRWGEKYFAQKLVDYDPAVNNGNWQWAASTGCDAQPYFRIFNPWLQQKKFDPTCKYIKQWIPELQNYTTQQIHAWYKTCKIDEHVYPQPIVDHAVESTLTKILYKNAK